MDSAKDSLGLATAVGPRGCSHMATWHFILLHSDILHEGTLCLDSWGDTSR